MAILIVDRPTQTVLPAYDNIIFALRQTSVNLSSTSVTQFAMYLQLKIYTDDGVAPVTRTLKAKANKEGKFFFDTGSLLQDFVSTDTLAYDGSGLGGEAEVQGSTVYSFLPRSIHQVDKFSRNKNAMSQASVFAYYEYFNTATNTYLSNQSYQLIDNYWVFNGVAQSGGNTLGNSSSAKDYITNYELKAGSGNRFLTSFAPATKRYVRTGDYATFSFINGGYPATAGSVYDYEAGFVEIEYKFYSSDGTLLQTSTHTNNEANGGEVTVSGGGAPVTTSAGTFEENNKGFLYVAVGPQNITNSGISIPASTSYYTVVGANTGATADSSATYTFYLQDDDCKGYETIRLVWLNRLGGWEYYNFTKKSTRIVNIDRASLKQNYGSWNDTIYQHNAWDGGTKNFSIDAIESIECNTDFLVEDEAAVLEELFTSPEVYMQTGVGTIANGVGWKPVVVTEKDYTKQTTANDMLKQYVVGIELSHGTRVQGV